MRKTVWISIRNKELEQRLYTEFQACAEPNSWRVKFSKKTDPIEENKQQKIPSSLYLSHRGPLDWQVSDRPINRGLAKNFQFDFPLKISEIANQILASDAVKIEFIQETLAENPSWVGGYFLLAGFRKMDEKIDEKSATIPLLEFALKNVIRSHSLQEKLIAVYQRNSNLSWT